MRQIDGNFTDDERNFEKSQEGELAQKREAISFDVSDSDEEPFNVEEQVSNILRHIKASVAPPSGKIEEGGYPYR